MLGPGPEGTTDPDSQELEMMTHPYLTSTVATERRQERLAVAAHE